MKRCLAAILAHLVALYPAQMMRVAFDERSNSDHMNVLQTRASVNDAEVHSEDHSVASTASSVLKRLFLLGPPDSGTNLLERSLRLNWEDQWRTHYVPGVWKHSMSENDRLFHLLANGSNMSDALVLVMIRSPISQMVSWYNAPYVLRTCFGELRPPSTVDQPCSANVCSTELGAVYPDSSNSNLCIQDNMDRWPDKVAETRLFPLKVFESAVDVYNSYLRQYRALQRDSRFPNMRLISYENLVFDPEAELASVAEQMGWQIPKTVSVLVSKAKNHVDKKSGHVQPCKDREQALKYQASRGWLQYLDSKVLAKMCSLLDRGALQGLYGASGKSKAHPYYFDCESQGATTA